MELRPLVSLILPVRNEAAYIERAMRAILGQNYPLDRMEILVVDGMSTDGTRQKVQDLTALYPRCNIRVLDNPDGIVPIGMNIALRQAKGDILIRVDGHCIIASDYVLCCVERLQNDGIDGVGGPMDTVGETILSMAIAFGMSSAFGVGNSAFRTTMGRSMLADTVPFPAYTRQIIRRAGLYDEELVRNQDDEYNYRIRELGGKILLAEDVHSTYFSRASFKNLWRQYFQYGLYKVRVLQKHPRQMSPRQFVPPLFVLALLISLFLAFFPITRFLSVLAPASYMTANLVASLLTASRRGWKFLPFLPCTFAILHLSYGLGFLTGLLKFRDRWDDKIGKTPEWSGESLG